MTAPAFRKKYYNISINHLTEQGKTDLGIPYIKQIVTEHQGSITLASREGAGTTVEIDLHTHLGILKKDLTDY